VRFFAVNITNLDVNALKSLIVALDRVHGSEQGRGENWEKCPDRDFED
jgi:hypothetical protein